MALTVAQQTEMDNLKDQLEELKKTVMNSAFLTNGGYGSIFFTAFENFEKQIKVIENT